MEAYRGDLTVVAAPFPTMDLLWQRGPVTVFCARDRSGKKVLVKQLDSEQAAHDPVGRARFQRELAIAAAMRHPGLVTCLDSGKDWLALEWLPSGLDETHRQHEFRKPAALRGLLAALAETLAYLHARGISHADLKPAHVRFRADTPVLIDFGIAAVGSRDPLFQQEFAGSPRWMAPELLEGAQPTPQADIWSLCAIAAWLWNGAPDSANDADTILEERRRSPASHAPDLVALGGTDAALRAILARGMGPPERRPTAVDLVQLISRSTAG